MADFNAVAKAFVEFYYQTFDRDRRELISLYRDQSMLTFEGRQTVGGANIVEQLANLPFQKVQHRISTTDAQPGDPTSGSILVAVTGQLLVDDEQNPQMFSQTFHLVPDGSSYWVYNDIFRLNYA